MDLTANDYDAVRLAWRDAVPLPEPKVEFIRGWLRSLPVADIEVILLQLKKFYNEGKLQRGREAEHAGRFVSSSVRKLRDAQETKEPAAPVQTQESARWRQSWPDMVTAA
jgi:hypothetical protein